MMKGAISSVLGTLRGRLRLLEEGCRTRVALLCSSRWISEKLLLLLIKRFLTKPTIFAMRSLMNFQMCNIAAGFCVNALASVPEEAKEDSRDLCETSGMNCCSTSAKTDANIDTVKEVTSLSGIAAKASRAKAKRFSANKCQLDLDFFKALFKAWSQYLVWQLSFFWFQNRLEHDLLVFFIETYKP